MDTGAAVAPAQANMALVAAAGLELLG